MPGSSRRPGPVPTGGFLEGEWPLVVGHRGNPALHPDNTLAGVMSGLEATGAVEVDVRMSRDGHLILSHDAVVGGMPVSSTDVADLPVTASGGLCLLDEVVGLPGRLDMDVKNLPGEDGFDPDGRLALMVASRARPADVLTSFYWPDMDRVREAGAPCSTGLVVGEGGSPWDALTHAAGHGHVVVAAHDSLVDQEVLGEANRLDVGLMAWTVNSVERARKLSGTGAAAIISDDPLLIRNGLRE